MKRQRALIIAGAAIAIGAVDVIPSVYADRGRPLSTSRSSTTRGRPPSSSSSRGRSNGSSTSPSKKSSPSRQRSVEEILDLDDLLMDESFNLNDDVDDLMGSLGGSSSSNSNNNRDIDMLDDLDDFDYDDEGDDLFDPLPPFGDEDQQDNNNNDDGMGDNGLMGGGGDDEYGQGSEKGALYDAYNLLHSLAQVSTMAWRFLAVE